MKTIKIKKTTTLENIKKVSISNMFMGTTLVQSDDAALHLTAELYVRSHQDNEVMVTNDFILINANEGKGIVEMEIEEPEINDGDFDISNLSVITIALPAQILVTVETDNYPISASGLANDLTLVNENGPIRMEECAGNAKITSENGPVKLSRLSGNLKIEEENGAISADNLTGQKLNLISENGPIKLRECRFEEVKIRNENGGIFYETLQVDKGSIEMENENGHIHLVLPPLQGFILDAKAELGQIKNSFMGQETTMFDTYKYEIGDKALTIDLATENGMIKISSSDMPGDDFFKGKLDYIKKIVTENSEQGLVEAHKIIGQLLSSLSKMLDKVSDKDIKDKIEKALVQLKAWKSRINDPEMKESLKDSFDSISREVGRSVQEALKAIQEAMIAAKDKYSEEFKPRFDKHLEKGKKFMKYFKYFPIPPFSLFGGSDSRVKEAMQSKARLKILEMLEAGKITSEEAEKLLKAIH